MCYVLSVCLIDIDFKFFPKVVILTVKLLKGFSIICWNNDIL